MSGRKLTIGSLGVAAMLGGAAYVTDWLLNRQVSFRRKLDHFLYGDDHD